MSCLGDDNRFMVSQSFDTAAMTWPAHTSRDNRSDIALKRLNRLQLAAA
jgi:hypothetical protein